MSSVVDNIIPFPERKPDPGRWEVDSRIYGQRRSLERRQRQAERRREFIYSILFFSPSSSSELVKSLASAGNEVSKATVKRDLAQLRTDGRVVLDGSLWKVVRK